jgi:hypothetical protein
MQHFGSGSCILLENLALYKTRKNLYNFVPTSQIDTSAMLFLLTTGSSKILK